MCSVHDVTGLLRAQLAARRWAVVAMLVTLTVTIGVLVMHAMSGSSAAHAGPAAVVHSIIEADAAAAVGDDDAGHDRSLHEHGAAEAMCAVALAVILTPAVPALRLLRTLPPPRAVLLPAAVESWRVELGRRPSLVVLGISRT
jgi:hypothetical protein